METVCGIAQTWALLVELLYRYRLRSQRTALKKSVEPYRGRDELPSAIQRRSWVAKVPLSLLPSSAEYSGCHRALWHTPIEAIQARLQKLLLLLHRLEDSDTAP